MPILTTCGRRHFEETARNAEAAIQRLGSCRTQRRVQQTRKRATVQLRKFKPAEDEQEDIDPDGSTMSLETLLNIHT
jgi:hypothetical protein